MNVFIGWSGDRSRSVARSLADWIPDVFLDVRTWMSDHDVQAGARWVDELTAQLDSCTFGIVCLTPENSTSPWILFEAGALSKAVGRAKVVPYLFGVSPANIEFPLAQFQGVLATKDGTFKLLESLNGMRHAPLDSVRLERAFSRWWPQLSDALATVPTATVAVRADRTDRDLLEELLALVRSQQNGPSHPASSEPAENEQKPGWLLWDRRDDLLNVSAVDVAAMDDGQLEHFRRQLHARFRQVNTREEEEAVERQQQLAEREYKERKKRRSPN